MPRAPARPLRPAGRPTTGIALLALARGSGAASRPPSSSLQRGLRAGGRSLATRASPPSSRTYSPLGARDGHRPRARACQAPPVRTPALGISCGNREPRRAWRRSPARPVTLGRSKPHCKKVMFAPFSRRGTALPSSQTRSGGALTPETRPPSDPPALLLEDASPTVTLSSLGLRHGLRGRESMWGGPLLPGASGDRAPTRCFGEQLRGQR